MEPTRPCCGCRDTPIYIVGVDNGAEQRSRVSHAAQVTLARTFVERVEVLRGEVVLVRLVPQLQQVRLLYQELRHPSVILNG